MNGNRLDLNQIPAADKDGLNAGVNVGTIDALRDTKVGLMGSNKQSDKSTYTRETKPDGTVVETVKMNKTAKDGGLFNVGTNGIGVDGIGVKAGLGEKTSQDAMGFVDSIWGSKQAAGKIADTRKIEAEKADVPVEQVPVNPEVTAETQTAINNEASKEVEQIQEQNPEVDQSELDEFRAIREQQLAQDAAVRQQKLNPYSDTMNNGMSL